jgi:hypothetical protein
MDDPTSVDVAREKVGEALEAWVNALPMVDRETVEKGIGILGDWVAVVCMVDVDEAGVPAANYYVVMRGGSMLPHVAHGLLDRGHTELDEREQGGDDE